MQVSFIVSSLSLYKRNVHLLNDYIHKITLRKSVMPMNDLPGDPSHSLKKLWRVGILYAFPAAMSYTCFERM